MSLVLTFPLLALRRVVAWLPWSSYSEDGGGHWEEILLDKKRGEGVARALQVPVSQIHQHEGEDHPHLLKRRWGESAKVSSGAD